jgi:hypothetical protein
VHPPVGLDLGTQEISSFGHQMQLNCEHSSQPLPESRAQRMSSGSVNTIKGNCQPEALKGSFRRLLKPHEVELIGR